MKHLHTIKTVITAALIALAVLVVYGVVSFALSDSWTAWGVGQVLSLSFSLLRWVFFATIPYLIAPIIIYWFLVVMLKNRFIRVAAGIGCVYLFWVFAGGSGLFTWSRFSSAPVGTAIKIIRMAVQIYLLVILVMPRELMNFIGAAAAVIGSVVIYIFPDAPGALDDVAAICTLISMVFVYLNTLALIVKQYSGRVIDKLSALISQRTQRRKYYA